MSNAPLFDRDLTSGDRQYAASGDTALVAGQALVVQRLTRRALATPGSIPLHPTFGCGLGAFVEAVIDDLVTATITGRIQEQFPRDPAVQSVDRVDVGADASGRLLVTVWVTLGADASTLIVPLSIH